MRSVQIMQRVILALTLTAGHSMAASAQLGSLLNQAKKTAEYHVRSNINHGINKGVNNGIDKAGEATVNAVKNHKMSKKERAEAVKEQTWNYGDHIYTMKGIIDYSAINPKKIQDKPTAWVTFTNIPSNYDEFDMLYREFLGLTPHGTAAMIAMAMEIYARDEAEGTRCMEKLCGKTAAMGNLRILKTKFPKPGQEDSDDGYLQRYLPAAMLKGATAKNGYTPDDPYTVEMCSHVNAPQGDFVYLYILGGGWDLIQRAATVKLLNDGHYQLVSCSSVYSQCQNMQGEWIGLR